jgi:peroxiredoxin
VPPLNPGDPFPKLTINVPGGRRLIIPGDFAGDFATVLFYRGSWCPYCNAQLRAFQRSGQALADAGIRVAALSADVEAATAELAAKHGLTFPVGYGADAPAVGALTGTFVNPDPVYLQSAGFVLDPAGNVVVSVRSSGAIGRLVPTTSSTSSVSSATCASTYERRRPDPGRRQDDQRRHPLLLRPRVPVAWITCKMGAHGRRATGLHRRLAFISLRMINSHLDYDGHVPAGYEEGRSARGRPGTDPDGRDVGTPIIQFNPLEGTASFRPAISRLRPRGTPSGSGTT